MEGTHFLRQTAAIHQINVYICNLYWIVDTPICEITQKTTYRKYEKDLSMYDGSMGVDLHGPGR